VGRTAINALDSEHQVQVLVDPGPPRPTVERSMLVRHGVRDGDSSIGVLVGAGHVRRSASRGEPPGRGPTKGIIPLRRGSPSGGEPLRRGVNPRRWPPSKRGGPPSMVANPRRWRPSKGSGKLRTKREHRALRYHREQAGRGGWRPPGPWACEDAQDGVRRDAVRLRNPVADRLSRVLLPAMHGAGLVCKSSHRRDLCQVCPAGFEPTTSSSGG
jgi:hypothetical protein